MYEILAFPPADTGGACVTQDFESVYGVFLSVQFLRVNESVTLDCLHDDDMDPVPNATFTCINVDSTSAVLQPVFNCIKTPYTARFASLQDVSVVKYLDKSVVSDR